MSSVRRRKRHARAIGLPLIAALLGWASDPAPLSATCTCTISASASEPTWSFSATSSGACEQRTAYVVHRDGFEVGFKDCGRTTTCSGSEERYSTCLRTGGHTVTLGCACGKNATDANGNPFCDVDSGSAETTFSVNTTPTVSVAASGPDVTGDAVISAPSTFPNTTRTDERELGYFVDGHFHFGSYDEGESGTWTFTVPTECWRQGSHDIKITATACHQSQDALFNAEAHTPLLVDHKPEVTLAVGAQQPDGDHELIVSYFYPQTKRSRERFLRLKAYPSGALIGEWNPFLQQGVWKPEVSCAEGKNRLLVVTAFACGDTETRAEAAFPGCPRPPRFHPCKNQCGCVGGGGPPGGPPGFGLPGSGPGAQLSYLGGGVGSPGNPGRVEWSAALGRNWSHDYAERIVADPSVAGRVWLLTRDAAFERYTDVNGDGVYEAVAPEDSYRTLSRVGAGWELRDLDGTVDSFDAAGRWTATRDRHGNSKTASYADGRLVAVTMPDGRREVFGYDAAGKLASITEIGVGGAAQRSWGYRWSGDDLVAIERPDGTELRFVYGDGRHPGLMTRSLLAGADDGDPGTPRPERVERAWDYDGEGNVARTWRGAEDFASGVYRVELAYDNPFEPEETTVTFHRSASERDTVVYTLSRTAQWVGAKARITSISGDCSSCGLGPNSQLFYGDGANPLRPTRILDGDGTETLLTYDARGQLIEKVEAAATPLARTTTWTYDPAFPDLPVRIEVPSTAGGSSLRTTVLDYDASGNPTSRRLQGVEAGSFFDLETVTTFNAAGQPLAIDPPGYGTADETSFTYDPARGDLVPLTRTDPLAGTTSFAYDAFNRRTAVVDANDLATVTAYDALDRTTSVKQEGATPAGDRVTTHDHDAFGDLMRTTLPRGNVVEYGYDAAGRLVSLERKPDAATYGERTLYTLDGLGNRVREELQRWNGTGWATESWTDFVYANRCQVQKIVHVGGAVTEHAYDCDGNLEKSWDENHPRSSHPEPTQLYAYDALNRLASVTVGPGTAGAAATAYAYDVQDHLAGVTDAEGNPTTYTTSDRDLMTRQVSPVSGTTTYAYNEHGELVSTTDARAVLATRAVDAADRVTEETFGPVGAPDPSLTTTYAYGSTPAQFDLGRLTGITRGGQTVGYTYDRFGRVLQDGALAYEYDRNGNRTRISYPGGVAALFTHDFADREATLSYDAGSGPQPLVTSAAYKAFGPLAGLTFGNGLGETRLFDARYFPDRIQAGSLLDWDYTVDAVGNPTAIAGSIDGRPYAASFAYQDHLYFLTEGDGPWGDRSWTYDRIGNRLSFARSGEPTLSHTYAGAGHDPKLLTISPAPGWGTGSWAYAYDAAGNQISIVESNDEGAVQTTFYDAGADGRMKTLRTDAGPASTSFLYDGRGFLRQAYQTVAGASGSLRVTPVYSSDGTLMARTEDRQWTVDADGEDLQTSVSITEATQLFYFAGRPVAQLTAGNELLYLTTDHLGTPVLATNSAGVAVWAGGVEPFGTTWTATADNPDVELSTAGAQTSTTEPVLSRLASERVFLRYPGQWTSDAFVLGTQQHLYYNLHRWYQAFTGRYRSPDPMGTSQGPDLYAYADNNPVIAIDPAGLAVLVCSRKTTWGIGNHSYFWDNRPGIRPDSRVCQRGSTDPEVGPPGASLPPGLGDYCNVVPGSDGLEESLMRCCQIKRDAPGLWLPPFNDCATMLDECIEGLGLTSPGSPGGRTGPPCDQCRPSTPTPPSSPVKSPAIW